MAERGSLDLLGPSTRRAVERGARGHPAGRGGRPRRHERRRDADHPGRHQGRAGRPAGAGRRRARGEPRHAQHVGGAGRRRRRGRRGQRRRRGRCRGRASRRRRRSRSAPPSMGAERGHWVAGADVAARIRWATGLVAGLPAEEAAEVIYSLVGTSLATQESVPAAFAVLSAVPDDPWRACLLAASLGGDCDTIAAMAGAIGGAVHGLAAFPRARGRGHRRPGPRARRPGRLPAGGAPMIIPNGGVLRPAGPRRLVFAGEAIVDVVMRVPGAAPARRRRPGDVLRGHGRRRIQRDGRRGAAGPAGALCRRARHRPVGRRGPRGAGRRRHRPAPPARPGPRHGLRRRAGRTRRRAHVRHASRRGGGARACGMGRGAGRTGRRGLRLRLRPGRRRTPARPSAAGRPRCRPASCCSSTLARWWRRSRPRCSIPSWPAATG